MANYSYRSLSPADIGACTDLWVRRMAPGYQNSVVLSNASSSVTGYTGVVVEASDTVVGFGVGHVGTFAGVISVPYADLTDCSPDPLDTVGYLDVVCVESDHEGQGLGTALGDSLVTQLSETLLTDTGGEPAPLVSEVWHRKGPDGGTILETLGFERMLADDDYWRHSTSGADACPECGSTPCECDGSLYLRRWSRI